MTALKDFRVGAHVVFSLYAHLVFATKYRRPVITQRVFDVIRTEWLAVCGDLEATLMESNCEGDHVHLLVAYPPKLSLAVLAQRLKGRSSRRVRQHRFPEVAKRLWDQHFWSASYCVVSCGGAPLDVIKRYVQAQTGATDGPLMGASPPR